MSFAAPERSEAGSLEGVVMENTHVELGGAGGYRRVLERACGQVFLILFVVIGLFMGWITTAELSHGEARFGAVEFDGTGELQVSVEDSGLTGDHTYRYDFVVADGEERSYYQLLFADSKAATGFTSGTIARVKGVSSETSEGESIIVVEQFEPLMANIFSEQAYIGERRVLPVRVVFTDGAPTASLADIAGYMWDAPKNLDGWYREISHGKLSFPRQLDGSNNSRVEEVAISAPKSGCNPTSWANAVDTALQNRGVSVSSFHHIFYFLPATGCNWAGLGNVGCSTTCRSWSNDYGSPNTSTADVMAHEAGHNIGLNHARTDENNTGVADCEYCDSGSLMGYGGIGYRGFNAQSMEQLGWLPEQRVVTSSNSQSYTVYPAEVNTLTLSPAPPLSAIQLLRVPYPGSASRHYLISYRKRLGSYSSNLTSEFHDKVSIHWGNLTDTYTYLITTLSLGQTYTSGALSFTYLASGDGFATVQVSNGAPPTATPTPSPTPIRTTTPSATPPGSSPTPTATPSPPPGGTPPSGPPIPTATPTPNGNPVPPADTPNGGEDNEDDDAIVTLAVAKLKGATRAQLIGRSVRYSLTLRNGRASFIVPAGTYQLRVRKVVRRKAKFVPVGNFRAQPNIFSPQVFRFRS